MVKAYYNEIDPFAAAWLRELIKIGQIAPGDVDERDIRDINPDDLRGYAQCHWFAGIGVWSYALRLAGFSDDAAVWTGSCPCQPFSAAGRAAGFADERHLWPAWFHLICVCRPPILFGEQVSSPDALRWFDLVQDDLEGEGYAVGAIDTCAAGVGAPHIRQRLYFVADSMSAGRTKGRARTGNRPSARSGEPRLMADSECNGSGSRRPSQESRWNEVQSDRYGATFELGHAGSSGLARPSRQSRDNEPQQSAVERTVGPTGGFWADAEWIFCRDEKWRAVESGTFPLAHGSPARVGRLRGYGNSLVAPLAAEFIAAYLDTRK